MSNATELLLVIAGLLLILMAIAVFGSLTYAILQFAFMQRQGRLAAYGGPPEKERPELPEERDARVREFLEESQQHAGRVKDEWAREKIAEGWTEEDVTDYLENRPLLELN